MFKLIFKLKIDVLMIF